MFIIDKKKYKTKKTFDIIDITKDVQNFLKDNKLKDGLINVFTKHTNEAEEGLWKDLENRNQKYVPVDNFYHHNDLESRDPKTMCENKQECLNGHAHIQSMMFGVSSETIPVKNGNILFGTWQRILLIEFDHSRDREIIFSFLGE